MMQITTNALMIPEVLLVVYLAAAFICGWLVSEVRRGRS